MRIDMRAGIRICIAPHTGMRISMRAHRQVPDGRHEPLRALRVEPEVRRVALSVAPDVPQAQLRVMAACGA